MLGDGQLPAPDLNFWLRSETEKKAVLPAAEVLQLFGTGKFESELLVQFDLQPKFLSPFQLSSWFNFSNYYSSE